MTHDEMIAVIAGHKAGRKVQCRLKARAAFNEALRTWGSPVDPANPDWNFAECDYRLAPQIVPPGDLTLEDARMLQESQVPIDYTLKDLPTGWCRVSWYGDEWERNVDTYREFAYRRTPQPPTPQMVPLEAKDVKPGDALRFLNGRDEYAWQIVVGVTKDGVRVGEGALEPRCLGRMTWDYMREHCEITRDRGATWGRCEREAKP